MRRRAGDVAAVAVVAPVDELAVAQDRVATAAVAGGVELRLPLRVQVRRREIPAAPDRVVLLGRTARVRDAVALVVGDRARLPLDAGDARAARDRRAQVEEVGVAAADALVLEVAEDDRELQALPAAGACSPRRRPSGSSPQVNPRLDLAGGRCSRRRCPGCRRRSPRPSPCCRCRRWCRRRAWCRRRRGTWAPWCRSSSSPCRRRRRGRSVPGSRSAASPDRCRSRSPRSTPSCRCRRRRRCTCRPAAVGQLAPGSIKQLAEQPSSLAVFLSSHFSPPLMIPSPQVGTHLRPGTRHSKPASTWQVALQPSLPVRLPSSHCSSEVRMPLPHFAVLMQG